jgi:hemerythrin-like domain-containing protein
MIQLSRQADHDFTQPLGLMTDCHRRIEQFLDILVRVADRAAGGPLDGEQARAMETAIRYFSAAAPKHTADEEESLFPLLRRVDDPRIKLSLERMENLAVEHRAAEIAHAEVQQWCQRWLEAGQLAPPQHRRLLKVLRDLRMLYRQHIRVEEHELFPLAERVLTGEQIEQLGGEMADRRGINVAVMARA